MAHSVNICLGVTVHHGVSDGKTTAMFLKAWAHTCKHAQEDDHALQHDLIPFMDRTVVQDPTDIYTKLFNLSSIATSNNKPSLKLHPPKEIGPDVVRVTYCLTPDNIQKLRELVLKTKSSSQLRLSTFVITFAYIITCKVKAHGGNNSTRLFCAGFSSDFRTRLNPPLPSTYFGNCLVGTVQSDLKAEPILEGEGKGFVSAVEIVSGWVEGLFPDKVEEIIFGSLEAYKRMEPGMQIIFVSGSNRFGLYESDFGWGKPVKIEIVTIDKNGAVAFSESGDGSGGVEIGVCLKEHEVERFGSLFSDGLQ